MPMRCAVSLPPQKPHSRFPAMGWLSGESIQSRDLHGKRKFGTSSPKYLILQRRRRRCRAQSDEVSEEFVVTGSTTRTQLELLQQLTSSSSLEYTGYISDGTSQRPTIREQLMQIIEDREGDFSLPLGKKLKASISSLTISQKRNIKRQSYLDKVSQRNDSVFFASIGLFILVPPFVILAVAVSTGYVKLLP